MERQRPGEVTQLLERSRVGDTCAFDELWPLIYPELRRLAHHHLRGEASRYQRSSRALVHEVYLQLRSYRNLNCQNRRQFFALASRVMRNILVDRAVRRNARKRGGGRRKVPLRESDAFTSPHLEDALAVRQALDQLECISERQLKVVECRFFEDLTVEETAQALQISPATVSREWHSARHVLQQTLRG